MRLLLIALLAAIAFPAAAATGEDLFDANCAECHALDAAPGQTAPPLRGVVGRRIASVPDFQYNDALKAKTGVWTPDNLEAFLAAPQTFAPGTAMYGRAADPNERKAIIDYLTSVK